MYLHALRVARLKGKMTHPTRNPQKKKNPFGWRKALDQQLNFGHSLPSHRSDLWVSTVQERLLWGKLSGVTPEKPWRGVCLAVGVGICMEVTQDQPGHAGAEAGELYVRRMRNLLRDRPSWHGHASCKLVLFRART